MTTIKANDEWAIELISKDEDAALIANALNEYRRIMISAAANAEDDGDKVRMRLCTVAAARAAALSQATDRGAALAVWRKIEVAK